MFNLRDDSAYILAADIPRRIAEKKYPIPEPAESTIKDVCKIEIVPINVMNFKGAPLNNTDEDLLINIMKNSGLDFDDYIGLTESQYKLFKAAFDSSENKPDWDILATFTNHHSEALNKQCNLAIEHSLLLESAARNGTAKILSSECIPLDKIEGDAYISREHAETYLKELGLTLNELGLSLPDAPNQQTEAVGDGGAVDDVVTEGAAIKTEGRNQKRTKILNEWYQALCIELKNNTESINQKIDSLTNEEIKIELVKITPQADKYLWASGADRWIMDNGESVWKFKRTQGGKSKKSK